MQKKKNNKFNIFVLVSFLIFTSTKSNSEIIILSSCVNLNDSFKKNEYILNMEKSVMTRNFIYDTKTFKKHKVTDIRTKKTNSITRFIYKEKNMILSDKIGYPQFFTQLIFEVNNLEIKIKTVINNEESVSILSKCKKIEKFENES